MSGGDCAPTLFPQGIYGVIFDCDGVMIDSREANSIFYNKVLACLRLPPMTPEQEAYSFMATAMQALERMVPPALWPRMHEVLRGEVAYARDILPLLRLRPGFRAFIGDLRARGVRMAVHTNRTLAGMQSVLDIFSLPSYFDAVVAADTAAPKPSPDGVRRICASWGCVPERVLVVGDSVHDKAAAEGAGAVFAAMNGGGLDGAIAVDSFSALHDAIADALPALAARQEGGAKGPEGA